MSDDRDDDERETLEQARARLRPAAEAQSSFLKERSVNDEYREPVAVNEQDLWHALTELLRCAPDQAIRTKMLTEAVSVALTTSMGRQKDLEAELNRPRVSEAAERTLTELLPDPPFSLPRLQRRTAMRTLEKEFEHWPEALHGELIREFREQLERRRNVLGEVTPRDESEATEWLKKAVQEGARSPDSERSMDDILAHVEKRKAFRELVQEILAQPDGEQLNAMRGAAGQMRRDRTLLENLSEATPESIKRARRHLAGDPAEQQCWLRDNREAMDDANRYIDSFFQQTCDAIASADRGECITQAEMEMATTEELGQADRSDRPRWGQITDVNGDGAYVWVWDGVLSWPVDTTESVANLIPGAVVWFRPSGEFAIVERVEKAGNGE